MHIYRVMSLRDEYMNLADSPMALEGCTQAQLQRLR